MLYVLPKLHAHRVARLDVIAISGEDFLGLSSIAEKKH